LYRTKHLRPRRKGDPTVTDRQERIKNFSQQELARSTIILIGCGGLGGEYGEALVRKGVGRLVLFDHDIVELTNLPRQKFYERDLYKPKAHRLALNLSKEGFSGTVIEGYSLSFEDALNAGIDLSCTLAIVGVDNNPCRVAASVYFREQQIPCIFCAVSETANNGYVYLQLPGQACFGCLFPDAVNDETYPCPGTPAILDILKVVGGMVSHAVDTIIMGRLRCFTYKEIFLDGSVPDIAWTIDKRLDCRLCSATPQDQSQTPIPSGQTEGSGL